MEDQWLSKSRNRDKQRSVSDTIILDTKTYIDDDQPVLIRNRANSISEGIIPGRDITDKHTICLVCGITMNYCKKCKTRFCKNHEHICSADSVNN
jgi:hypothetical protein